MMLGQQPQKLSEVLEETGVRLMDAIPKQPGLSLDFYKHLMTVSHVLAACTIEARIMEMIINGKK